MHKLTYEDVEQAHIDRLKALGYTDEEILGSLKRKTNWIFYVFNFIIQLTNILIIKRYN